MKRPAVPWEFTGLASFLLLLFFLDDNALKKMWFDECGGEKKTACGKYALLIMSPVQIKVINARESKTTQTVATYRLDLLLVC